MKTDSLTGVCGNRVDERTFAQATQQYAKANYEAAMSAISPLVDGGAPEATGKGPPTVRDAIILKARILYSLGRFSECQRWLASSRKSARLPVDDIDARAIEMTIQLNKGQNRKVIEEVTRILGPCAPITGATAEIMFLRGLARIKSGDIDSALDDCRDSRALFRMLQREPEIGELYVMMGDELWSRGRLSDALEYFQASLAIYTKRERNENLSGNLRRLGRLSEDLGRFAAAREYLHAAVSLVECSDPLGLSDTLIALGEIACKERVFCQSRECLTRARTIAAREHSIRGECQALAALGGLTREEGDPEEALRFLARSKRVAAKSDCDGVATAVILRREGQCLLDLGRVPDARATLTTALELARNEAGAIEQHVILRCLGEVDLRSGLGTDALQKLDRAAAAFTRIGAEFELALTYFSEAVFASTNSFDAARSVLTAVDESRALRCAWKAWYLFDKLGLEAWCGRAWSVSDALNRPDIARRPITRGCRKKETSVVQGQMVAVSDAMKRLLALADEYALLDAPVLITGETGTGKELIARRLHDYSERRTAPLVVVNCGAVPNELFEREFFGHAQGAYTGAGATSPGYVEHAKGGTLFLDEIADLPLALQAKLLRLIECSSYYRLGDPVERRANIRVIAATNGSLSELVAEKAFRADLYYRLRAVDIHIPPLRERPEDIIPLLELFLGRITGRCARALDYLTPDEISDLLRKPLHGNARDLMYLAQKLTVNGGGVSDLPPSLQEYDIPPTRGRGKVRPTNQELTTLMERYDGNKAKLARHCGVARSTLYRWLADAGS